MRVIVATSNAGKIEELRELLPAGTELVSLRAVGLEPPEETGATFAENALLKAAAALRAGSDRVVALADDSGLEVDALGGRPGVRSARYAGDNASDDANNAKLLAELADMPAGRRTARFRSAVALADCNGLELIAEGAVEGRIAERPRGQNGFGYDPLFVIDDASAPQFHGRTMAELSTAEKNRISHRSRAFRRLLRELAARGIDPQRYFTDDNYHDEL